ncbi:hypothetical protein GCM10027586_12880 [Kineococcus gypseus]|uniref:hypothetical protein n=1 Tax=Kineococcus gypseus TaxID=1637102 RepID=UPI003D7E3B48
MTGPEHYRKAEDLLDKAKQSSDPTLIGALLQTAQVHATLALAAATIQSGSPLYSSAQAWHEATS